MAQFLFKRSGTADKRPDPAQMALGEVDLNYNATTGGLFYKDSAGTLIKVGPAEVGTNPPNSTPAGSAGNSLGEFWYNTGDGFLYIWDGSNWNTTAPGVGLASPTVPGVVYGLTADTELNVALGKGAGSNITTGTCNVALGPNVAVASATGNCQLAIGFSATDNWITGNSTKAIKLGAGLIDCADSTGTAGQLLSSTGANALEWTTPNYISPTALNASSAGALIVNGCDFGGGVCFTSILPGPGLPGQVLTNAYDAGNPGYLSAQGYLNWCTPNFISQSSFSPGALVVGCTPGTTGGICTVGSLVNINNPGVAVGYYQGVTVTTCTGAGSGALANVNVINAGYFPVLDSVEIVQPGTGYALANTVGFEICGTTVTTTGAVCSLDQSTICKAGYLSVGTNGQVLTADSACALGVKWAAAGGGGGSAATPTAAGIVLGTTTASNTGIGCNALNVTLTGTDNVAAGLCALFAVTGGLGNTAAGNFAAAGTTTGCYNVAMGLSALRTNSTGTRNVAIGENAGRGNTTGCFNVAVGSGALCATTSATDNTAVGYQALFGNTTSVGNTALGSLALTASTGISNTGIGLNALRGITTGQCNTALGANAACTSTSGDSNVSIGAGVQLPVITGSCQLAIGFGANYWLTGCSTKAIRPGAGIMDCAGATGTAGQFLLSNGANAIRWGSGCSGLTGTFGTLLGYTDFTSANTAVGPLALNCIVNGATGASGNNTAIGRVALANADAGGFNTAVGVGSICELVTGCLNTGIGYQSLVGMTGGCFNVGLGAFAGSNLTSGNFNVAIGYSNPLPSATGSCQLAIGFNATSNWLTGDSTKAIRPGAGIVDCAGSCGTNGQILASNGANAICWVSVSGVSAATPSISGSVFGCADTVNAAIGSGVFAARTTGGCNSALGLAAFPALTTGCYNIALGDSGGSTITTGCYNVTIGSGVTVPNATGSCQLAIGAQSGSLWLTGDSTLAIKPGAGIIDCTGSCGNAGQYLCSSGSNSVVWATPPNPWATAAAFEAPVTNGTKICVIGWPSEESTTWNGQMSLSTTYDDGTNPYWIPGSNAIIMINGFMGGGTSTVQAFNTSTGTFAVEGVAYGSQSDITVTFTPSINAVRMNFYIGYMDLSLTGGPGFGLLTTNVTQFTPPAANPNI